MLTAYFLMMALAEEAQETTAVDVDRAMELGMPRLHQPFTDCQCVAMTWVSGEDTLVLELPREEIAHFEHKSNLDGPHELSIRTLAGQSVLLEQAPCVFVARQLQEYTYLLDLPGNVIDADGAATKTVCRDPLEKADEWQAERWKKAISLITPSSQGKNSNLDLVSAKGDDATVLGVRASMSSVRPNAGLCFEKGGVAAGSQMTVSIATRPGGVQKIKTGSVGVAAVDACFVELANAVSLPDGKSKVRMIYSPLE